MACLLMMPAAFGLAMLVGAPAVAGYGAVAYDGGARKQGRDRLENLDLSQKRAESVMQFAISQGVKPELIAAKGFGENDPVAPNNTPANRAQNRRVEISLATPSS